MRRFLIPAAVAMAFMSTGAAAADWQLTFTGSLFNPDISPGQPDAVNLVLNITTEDQLSTSTATYNLGQGYRITSFSGTRNGAAVTGLLSSADAFFSFGIDSYLYPSDPQLVGGAGLGYQMGDGTLYSLYGFTATFMNPPEVQQWEMSSLRTAVDFPPNVTYLGSITLAPVPEPATYALMLAGLAAVAGVARRRTRG
jgi:hypothetical protein